MYGPYREEPTRERAASRKHLTFAGCQWTFTSRDGRRSRRGRTLTRRVDAGSLRLSGWQLEASRLPPAADVPVWARASSLHGPLTAPCSTEPSPRSTVTRTSLRRPRGLATGGGATIWDLGSRRSSPVTSAVTVARPVAMSAACTLTWSRCHSGAHYMLIARIKLLTSRYHAHRAEEQVASGKCTPAAKSEKPRPIPAAAYPNRRSATRGGVRNRHPASPHAWSRGKRRVRSPAT